MTNWQACKYSTLMALQNDGTKNSLWRSIVVINPRASSFATILNKGKGHPGTQPFKRPHGGYNLLNSHGSSINFSGNGSKSASRSKGVWARLKVVNADSKSYRSASFDKFGKRKGFNKKTATPRTKLKYIASLMSLTNFAELMLA